MTDSTDDTAGPPGTKRRLWVVLGALAVVVALPLLGAALSGTSTISAGTVFDADSGPTVEVGETVDADISEPFPDANTVSIGVTNVSGAEQNVTLTGPTASDSLSVIQPDAGYNASDDGALTLARNDTALSAVAASGPIDELGLDGSAAVTSEDRDFTFTAGSSGDPNITITGISGPSEVAFASVGGGILSTAPVSNGNATYDAAPGESGPITVLDAASYTTVHISGYVTDPAGNPLQGADIVVAGWTMDTTDASGAYNISVTGTGDYSVTARNSADHESQVVTVPSGGVQNVNFTLDAPEPQIPINGTVLDLNSDPIENAEVETAGDATTTDANGDYTLVVSQPGTYTVTASTSVDSATATVTVPDESGVDGVDFVLEAGDSDPGDPQPGDGNLELRSEQTGALLNDRNITVDVFGSDTASQLETDTGIVDLADLDQPTPVVVQGTGDTVESRRIIIDDTSIDHNLFLMETGEVPAEERLVTQFELIDRTGFSDDETRLYIERSMPLPGETEDIPYRTLASDWFSVDERVELLLEADQRHRLVIENGDGDVRELGAYIPTSARTVPLEIGELDWQLGQTTPDYRWDAARVNASGVPSIRFQYQDNDTQTEHLDLTIYETGNKSNRTIHDVVYQGPVGNVSTLVPVDQYPNVTSWTVEWSATRNGNSIDGKVTLGPGQYPVPIDSDLLGLFAALLLVFVAGFFSVRVSLVGAVVVPVTALGLWAMDWLPVSLLWVLTALALGVAAEFANRGGFSQDR